MSQKLANVPPEKIKIISSGVLRAHQTATIISRHFEQKNIEINEDLKELTPVKSAHKRKTVICFINFWLIHEKA